MDAKQDSKMSHSNVQRRGNQRQSYYNSDRSSGFPSNRQSYYRSNNREYGHTQNYSNRNQYVSYSQSSGYGNSNYPKYADTQVDTGYSNIVSDVEISKEIVRIVRHGKYKWIHMDDEGYVKVDDILKDQKFQRFCGNVTFDDVKRIVESNDKKRFELKWLESNYFIKATQGHTVQVSDLALKPITDPNLYPNIFHGTYFSAWEEIRHNGLQRMQRNHIHFAIGMPDDPKVISGMRKSSDVAIEIDLEKALKAGLKFYISSNNVVLSEGDHKGRIHPKFFRRVFKVYPMQKLEFGIPPDFDDEEPKQQTVLQKGNGDFQQQSEPLQQPLTTLKKNNYETNSNGISEENLESHKISELVFTNNQVENIESKDIVLDDTNNNNADLNLNATEDQSEDVLQTNATSVSEQQYIDNTNVANITNKTKKRKKRKAKAKETATQNEPIQKVEEIKFVLPVAFDKEAQKVLEEQRKEEERIAEEAKKQNAIDNGLTAVSATAPCSNKHSRKIQKGTGVQNGSAAPIEFTLPSHYVDSKSNVESLPVQSNNTNVAEYKSQGKKKKKNR